MTAGWQYANHVAKILWACSSILNAFEKQGLSHELQLSLGFAVLGFCRWPRSDISSTALAKASKETLKNQLKKKWRYGVLLVILCACGSLVHIFYVPILPYWLLPVAGYTVVAVFLWPTGGRSRSLVIMRAALGLTFLCFVVWLMQKFVSLEMLPALPVSWTQAGILVATVAVIAYAWRRRRRVPKLESIDKAQVLEAEPPPSAAPAQKSIPQPNWDQMFKQLSEYKDFKRLKHLHSLYRIYNISTEEAVQGYKISTEEAVQSTIAQEATRMMQDFNAEVASDSKDVLDELASLAEYAAAKAPELFMLDVSDILLMKVNADIKAKHSGMHKIFIDHRALRAIHPIDREGAIKQCEERAGAAAKALPSIVNNGMRLSEALIEGDEKLSEFRSVTGFQVVQIPGGYVTVEGNGRREALVRAFGGKNSATGIEVEVRLFEFPDAATQAEITELINEIRRRKGVVDV